MDPNDQNQNPTGEGQTPTTPAGDTGMPQDDDSSMPSTPPPTSGDMDGGEPEIAPPTPAAPESPDSGVPMGGGDTPTGGDAQ